FAMASFLRNGTDCSIQVVAPNQSPSLNRLRDYLTREGYPPEKGPLRDPDTTDVVCAVRPDAALLVGLVEAFFEETGENGEPARLRFLVDKRIAQQASEI